MECRLISRFDCEPISIGNCGGDGGNLRVPSDYRYEVSLHFRALLRFADESIEGQFEMSGGFLESLGIDQMSETEMSVFHRSSLSFPWVRIRVRPSAKARLNSCENLSRSCLTMVPLASFSSQWSTNLTERQCAMCRSSPLPNTPFNMPAVASRLTCPPCSGVSGRPVMLLCSRINIRAASR